jgi:histidine kinase
MSESASISPTVVETLQLDVHPSVVFKLGADLITDDMQALMELIKNSYDADATRVRVSIDTHARFDRKTGERLGAETSSSNDAVNPDDLVGEIVIVDDGTGMDLSTIRRGWLTVSLSHKLEMKEAGRVTAKKRTPLGDKGLGRLGAQRLGDQLYLSTTYRSENQESVAPLNVVMNWSDFAGAESLSSVPIDVRQLAIGSMKPGTRLEIRGLRDPGLWRQHETNDLQRELASMISPYEGVSGFDITLTIDAVAINLREKAQEVLKAAPVAYAFEFDGEKLVIAGNYSTLFLRQQGAEEIAAYDELIGRDNGYAFSEWLLAKSDSTRARPLGIAAGDDHYFLRSESVIDLSSLKNVELADEKVVSPGPFHGEVSAISLARDTSSIFDRASDYKEFVRALVGIKVYRDGFGVRVDEDWLGLGEQWTSGGSYYSLRPGNVSGYVSISAEQNAALEETTNREAFRDTPAYRNFLLIMKAWAAYAARVQEHLRRGYNEYKREKLAQSIDVSPRITPRDLIKEVNRRISEGSELAAHAAETKQVLNQIEAVTYTLKKQKESADQTVFHDPALSAVLDETVAKLKTSVVEARVLIAHLDHLTEAHDRMSLGVDLLEEQLRLAQDQISDAWESVALGLGAESLAHEVQHISDGLRGRSAQIIQYLKASKSTDQRVWTFVEHVRSSASGLSKQVARILPGLRYMRESRDDLRMSTIAQNLEQYFSSKWGANGLRLEIDVVNDFSIRVNEGKLTQVFDNLILNSEYWLLQQIFAKKANEGIVRITIDAPFITVEDDGIGVDESIEELAFEPFITMKPSQSGRGLGLFVVRQLLDSMGASIRLSPDRNSRGRRYKFRIHFSNAKIVKGI